MTSVRRAVPTEVRVGERLRSLKGALLGLNRVRSA